MHLVAATVLCGCSKSLFLDVHFMSTRMLTFLIYCYIRLVRPPLAFVFVISRATRFVLHTVVEAFS
jgi:hypothetical protein